MDGIGKAIFAELEALPPGDKGMDDNFKALADA